MRKANVMTAASTQQIERAISSGETPQESLEEATMRMKHNHLHTCLAIAKTPYRYGSVTETALQKSGCL